MRTLEGSRGKEVSSEDSECFIRRRDRWGVMESDSPLSLSKDMACRRVKRQLACGGHLISQS